MAAPTVNIDLDMLCDVQTKIIDALEASGAPFRTVDVFQGVPEDLGKIVHALPSAHVLVDRIQFLRGQDLRQASLPAQMLWTVIIMSENVRDQKSGATQSLKLIMQTIKLLTRLDTGYGLLWPTGADLIFAEKGKAAYGVDFIVKKAT